MHVFTNPVTYFVEGKSEKIFVVLSHFFTDHEVEYIVSLSHCFFFRIIIS